MIIHSPQCAIDEHLQAFNIVSKFLIEDGYKVCDNWLQLIALADEWIFEHGYYSARLTTVPMLRYLRRQSDLFEALVNVRNYASIESIVYKDKSFILEFNRW